MNKPKAINAVLVGIIFIVIMSIAFILLSATLTPIFQWMDGPRDRARADCESHTGYRYLTGYGHDAMCVKVLPE